MLLFWLSYSRDVVDQRGRGGQDSGRLYDVAVNLEGMYSRISSCLMRRLRLRWERSSLMSASEGESMWKHKKARAQDRFLRGGQSAYMIYEHVRATGAHEAALALSDIFTVSSQGDDTQDFNARWDQALSAANALESLYKMRIRESVQLVTFSAMYEQENDQNRAVPSYQRLKTKVRRHIDHTIRNAQLQSQRPKDREYWSKVKKGKMSALKGDQ